MPSKIDQYTLYTGEEPRGILKSYTTITTLRKYGLGGLRRCYWGGSIVAALDRITELLGKNWTG